MQKDDFKDILEKMGWVVDYYRTHLSIGKRFFIALLLVLVVVAIVMVCVFGFRNSSKDERQSNDDENTIVVATDYGQTDYYIVGDTVSGYQYEMVKAMEEALHVKVTWKFVNSLSESLEMLEDGDVDMIARNIPITTQLRERFDFSMPIQKMPLLLVQRNAESNHGVEPVRNQLDLAGKTVYVPYNSPHILRLDNLQDEIADTIVIKQIANYEAEQIMMMVARGDIDYAAVDQLTARRGARDLPQLDVATALSFVQLQAWAFAKGENEELRHRVDSFLLSYLNSKSYRKMRDKYIK